MTDPQKEFCINYIYTSRPRFRSSKHHQDLSKTPKLWCQSDNVALLQWFWQCKTCEALLSIIGGAYFEKCQHCPKICWKNRFMTSWLCQEIQSTGDIRNQLQTVWTRQQQQCTLHRVQAAVWMAIPPNTFLPSEIQFSEKEKYGFQDQEIYIYVICNM